MMPIHKIEPPIQIAPRGGATTPTAPRVARARMPAQPWQGLLRGSLMALLYTLMPSLKFQWREPAVARWADAAQRRRRSLLAVVLAFAAAAGALLWHNAPQDPSVVWMLYAGLGVLLTAWVGAGTATALMGALVLLRGDRHALKLKDPRAPVDAHARTAVIMPICNEDIATVFSGLRATCESVAATGALKLFDFYLLSDTTDPALRGAELKAWERLRTLLGDNPIGAGARVFYRLRRRRGKRKSGNVEDFCRRWGKNYRYMVVLDADSTMHGDTLVNLVRLMEQHPKAGIIQTLPQAYGHNTLHARVQQFATRVTGRIFALGMAYWQLGESHYWGHNAILRVEPFMQHCALAPIKGSGSLSGDILSHDFVEAAMMGRAGYEVWLAPDLEGSWEQLPPNLLDELDRDRRWCRGNLQNAQLIAEPGWRPVHRVMFGVGTLSYLMGPVWLIFVALGLWAGLQGAGESRSVAMALWGLTLGLLLAPRALGVLAVRLRGEHVNYGGSLKLAASAVLELGVSILQAPVRMLAYSVYVLSTITGLKLEWRSPPRDAAAVAWRDAFARLGVFCVPLLLLAAWAFSSRELAAPHIAPLWLALAVAIPLTVMSSQSRIGLALRRARMLLVPDEARTPATLARAIAQRGFSDLAPVPALAAPAAVRPAPKLIAVRAKPRAAASMPWPSAFVPRLASAFASVAVVGIISLMPPHAETPALPLQVRAQIDMAAAAAYGQTQLDEPVMVAEQQPRRVRVQFIKPARMIDDEVRERAREAVRRSIYGEDEAMIDSEPAAQRQEPERINLA
jgi:membrane glycosyltransferase